MILTVLKINNWSIKFKVDNKIYFIKDVDDCQEYAKTIWQYIPTDKKGHYKTKSLKTTSGSLNIYNYVGSRHGLTYTHINKPKFFAQLVKDGFGDIIGMDQETIWFFEKERKIIACKEKIQKLEKELEKEQYLLRDLLGYNND